MDWIEWIAPAVSMIALLSSSERSREVLGTIFKRPRRTTLIVHDGKEKRTIEVDASTPEETRRLIEAFLAAEQTSSADTQVPRPRPTETEGRAQDV